MRIRDIIQLLKAQYDGGGDPDAEVTAACGSDLMSDVLAFVKDQAVLLTGLVNPQVIRTAAMMDMKCVILVRGKKADANMIMLAKSTGIALLQTDYNLFTACGLLYEAGLRGGV